MKLQVKKLAAAGAAFLVAATSGCGASAASGDYEPASRVRVLVGYAAGGGVDTAARGMAKELSSELDGSEFYVENLDGSAGLRAMQTLVRDRSDDTLMQQIDVLTPLYEDGVPIDFDDVTPVAQTATTPAILVVGADSGIADAEGLFDELATSHDVTIGLASTLRTREAAAWHEMADAASVPTDNLNLVPHDGVAEVLPDLIAGRATAALVPPSAAQGYFKTGELIPLAVLSDRPVASLPDVPTLKEEGYDVTYSKPFGVIMSSEASEEAVAYWADALKTLAASPGYVEFAKNAGFEVEYKDPDEYATYLEEQGKVYRSYLDEAF